MSSTDVKVDKSLEKSNLQEIDSDDILAELEREDDSAFRAQRIQQISEDTARLRPNQATALKTEVYKTLTSDDELLRFTTENQKTVVHFSHSGFARCSIMDMHLRTLAEAHARSDESEIQFAKVDVKDCGFVVEKLGVRILPCVIGFLDGQGVGRVVGFEGVVWPGAREDGFDVTKALEGKFVEWKLEESRITLVGREQDESDQEEELDRKRTSGRRGIRVGKKAIVDDDEEWD